MRIATTIAAAVLGGALWASGDRHGLDLPVTVERGSEAEEPASLVEFYGELYEADSVVFVIDASGSMRESGEWEVAKRELLRSLEDYRTAEVGCVVYSVIARSHPPSGLLRPGRGSRASLRHFLAGVAVNGRTCVHRALEAGLQLCRRGRGRRALVLLTDGGGSCQGVQIGSPAEGEYLRHTLAAATYENGDVGAAIHTVGVLSVSSYGLEFLCGLAGRNNGTYRRVAR